MRLLPLLMLVLLLVGFAARPTVSAALTSGQVMLHPIEVASGFAQATQASAKSAPEGQATFTHCASLGILPDGWLVMARLSGSVIVQQATSSTPVSRLYGLLRPPQA